MIKQQVAMMATEGVQLQFTDDAVQEIAAVAEEVNRCGAGDNMCALDACTFM